MIAVSGSLYDYGQGEDILASCRKKEDPPFILIQDGIEDPHNLGIEDPVWGQLSVLLNQAGAHGVIIPKRRGRRTDTYCSHNIGQRIM